MTQGDAPVQWDAPEGWTVTRLAHLGRAAEFEAFPPPGLRAGEHRFAPSIAGQAGFTVRTLAYPHIGPGNFAEPACLRVLALDLAISPDTRIAYVGGGSDRVAVWLRAMGFDVVEIDAAVVSATALADVTTVVIGVAAFAVRPELALAAPALRHFVTNGGNLVTLVQRPGAGWDADATPPLPLRIGTPSIRYRVTDPAAPVVMSLPDHPLLAGPNRIVAADWLGWRKERGLYFAQSWDPAYAALLALCDDGEEPLRGGLLSARIGAGRHTHVSLNLSHQLDCLVPGAFRLLANLARPCLPG